MSDPAKSVEIEDVLSSIRRLVSEEGRSEGRSKGPATRPGKLVLTPALRVADRSEDETPAEEPVLQADAEAEGGADEASAPWTDPDATLFSAAQAAGEPIIETNPVVEEEDIPEPAMLAELDVPDIDVALDTEEPLSARIEVLEAVIAQTDDDWEPDGLSPDAYSGTRVEAMEWQDHLAPAEEEATQVEFSTDDAPVSFDHDVDDPEMEDELEDERSILSPEEGYLDEESLRELVADIVREELQGALGERITRNVRKLVRREIHRALTAQEFE